ncbi:trypsin-like peptidase domain-containing protein [Pseudonocardia ailaonensis]|uniref:Trypsin-like peptidase domain-containing protein n=1 Tax=Pseudonocardia ailaonensis TaxID=367279 RepID=A0ABN2NBH7_9PSEU
MRGTRLGVLAAAGAFLSTLALVAACGTPSAAAVSTLPQTPDTPAPTATSIVRPAATPQSAVGAIFGGDADDLGDHFCSGSVIDSPAGDVVMTAAHCVADGDGTPAHTGQSFVPGYHDGTVPYGVWTVQSAYVDQHFLDNADPDFDVAFLTVVPDNGAPAIQDVTGGFGVALDPGTGDQVQAIGYPIRINAPTTRSGVTKLYSPTQLELPAPGLENGTSGGPWLRDSASGLQIVGVTGGYEQGGYDFDTSYSTYLSPDFGTLEAQAVGDSDSTTVNRASG